VTDRVKLEDNSAAAGMILRDEDGQVVFSACQNMECSDPLEAETLACHEAAVLALQLSDKPILVEPDHSC
jgi:hypothetical protein